MQQVTTLHTPRRHGNSTGMIILLALLTVIVVAITAWLSQPAAMPPPPISPVAERTYNRFFADEAAYVPTAAEYANLMLDENYLPLPQPASSAAPVVAAPPIQHTVVRWQNRIFADEAAYTPTGAEYANLMLSDSYLPLPQPAVATPLIRNEVVRWQNRIFADEAAYTPIGAEYANLMLSDSYLPLPTQPVTRNPQSNRIFLDEIAGAAAPQIATGATGAVEPIVPLNGPR